MLSGFHRKYNLVGNLFEETEIAHKFFSHLFTSTWTMLAQLTCSRYSWIHSRSTDCILQTFWQMGISGCCYHWVIGNSGGHWWAPWQPFWCFISGSTHEERTLHAFNLTAMRLSITGNVLLAPCLFLFEVKAWKQLGAEQTGRTGTSLSRLLKPLPIWCVLCL